MQNAEPMRSPGHGPSAGGLVVLPGACQRLQVCQAPSVPLSVLGGPPSVPHRGLCQLAPVQTTLASGHGWSILHLLPENTKYQVWVELGCLVMVKVVIFYTLFWEHDIWKYTRCMILTRQFEVYQGKRACNPIMEKGPEIIWKGHGTLSWRKGPGPISWKVGLWAYQK